MHVDEFLPCQEQATAAGVSLPEYPVRSSHRYAALLMIVHVYRRTVWFEEREMSRSDAKRYPSGAPEVDQRARSLHRVHIDHVVKRRGSRLLVRLAHYTDRVEKLRDVFIPSAVSRVPAMHAFESAVEELVAGPPAEVLRCKDLKRSTRRSYRGRRSKRNLDFHGHDFADTIEQAEQALKGFLLKGQILNEAVAAYAWPFLWLRYAHGDAREAALIVGRDRVLHLYTGLDPRRRR